MYGARVSDGRIRDARCNVMVEERRKGASDRRTTWRGGRRAVDQLRGPVVLIVDDHVDSRELVAAVLASDGIATAEAGTGVEALERMHALPMPRLVILDLRLPDCHGTDLIRSLYADVLTADVPVLVVSALVTAADRQAATDAGAVGFLAKPILPDLMLDAVRRALRMRQTP
jgi:putative two-component system response regulator